MENKNFSLKIEYNANEKWLRIDDPETEWYGDYYYEEHGMYNFEEFIAVSIKQFLNS